jgi:RNA polymerase sigma-70 factor (ECF subfamily)
MPAAYGWRMTNRTMTETLLANAEWLRRLATCLVDDAADAADLVQGTWVAALRRPPAPDRPPRPWLAQVLRNVFRMEARASARRRAREKQAARDLLTAQPSAPVVLERLQIQKTVAALLVELEEPYRTTLTLRFFDGLEPAAIGRMQDVPAGTVRWRVNEGLRRLRQRLDEVHGGRRDAWRSVLLPLLAPRGRRGLTAMGSLGSKAGLGAAGGLALTAVVLVTGAGGARHLLARKGPPTSERRPAPSAQTALAQAAGAMARINALGPPLFTRTEDPTRLLTHGEAIDLCLELRQKALACRHEVVRMLAARVPIHVAIGLVDRDPLPRLLRLGTVVGAPDTPPGGPPLPRRVQASAAAPAIEPARILKEIDPSAQSEAACAAAVDRSPWISRATAQDRDDIRACEFRDDACASQLTCRRAALMRVGQRTSGGN